MDNSKTSEADDKIIQLEQHIKILQIQLQSQKLIIQAIISSIPEAEAVLEQYQQLIDDYENISHKKLPNLLICC